MAPQMYRWKHGVEGVVPSGRTILIRDVDVNCVPPTHSGCGVVAHCGMESAARVLLRMESKGLLQDLIPDVWQLKLAYVPIKG